MIAKRTIIHYQNACLSTIKWETHSNKITIYVDMFSIFFKHRV